MVSKPHLSDETRQEIILRSSTGQISNLALAEEYGVHPNTITNILKREGKTRLRRLTAQEKSRIGNELNSAANRGGPSARKKRRYELAEEYGVSVRNISRAALEWAITMHEKGRAMDPWGQGIRNYKRNKYLERRKQIGSFKAGRTTFKKDFDDEYYCNRFPRANFTEAEEATILALLNEGRTHEELDDLFLVLPGAVQRLARKNDLKFYGDKTIRREAAGTVPKWNEDGSLRFPGVKETANANP